MKKANEQTKLQHLLLRAGFGADMASIQEFSGKSLKKVVKKLFQAAETIRPFEVINEAETKAARKEAVMDLIEKNQIPAKIAKKVLDDSREKIGDLNYAWLQRMASGEGALREKMTLFWHGHFACRIRQPLLVQQQNNVLRKNALGNFGDLLVAVSKDPAMLQFLNNQQNRKASPNENFAREVMELFTLGKGNYTEHDIKEAARAFTGWGFDFNGQFQFRIRQHDDGEKTIFGKTGNFSGEDVIKMILDRPETARFVARKIYRYFVNENENEQIINDLGKRFYNSKYDIAALMEYVFTADWFYDPQNIGTRIKSPVELLVGMQRQLGIEFRQKGTALFIQKLLGQILLYPPNVAGWSGGKNWIDSSTLIIRMKLPENIGKAAELETTAKNDGDADTDYLSKQTRNFNAIIHWDTFLANFQGKLNENMEMMSTFLLQTGISSQQKELIISQLKPQNDLGANTKEMALKLMALPEYQLG